MRKAPNLEGIHPTGIAEEHSKLQMVGWPKLFKRCDEAALASCICLLTSGEARTGTGVFCHSLFTQHSANENYWQAQ